MLKVALQLLIVVLLCILIVFVIMDIALNFGWKGVALCSIAIGALAFGLPRSLKAMLYQVKEGTVAVIERGGAFHRIAKPGPTLLGLFDTVRAEVPMHEIIFECEPQHVLTGSAIPIDVEMVMSYQIIRDSEAIRRAVYNIYNWREATERRAIAALHTAIGEFQLLAQIKGEAPSVGNVQVFVSNRVREILERETEKWGVAINQVYLRNIQLTELVTDILYGEDTAKRLARIERIKAQGEREATIAKAQGERSAMITTAKGERQAMIAKAEGEREAMITKAEGKKEELVTIAEGERAAKIKTGEADVQILQQRERIMAEARAEGIRQVFAALYQGRIDEQAAFQYVATTLLTGEELQGIRRFIQEEEKRLREIGTTQKKEEGRE